MIRDGAIAAIRTGVAAIAGLFVTWLVSLGIDVPEEFAANVTMVLVVFFTGLYNLLVIFLEQRVNPIFGVLLGIPKTPTYVDSAGSANTHLEKGIGNDENIV